VPNGPALAPGTLAPPAGPYLLGVGDLRAKKNWGVLVAAWRALRRDGLPHRLVLAGADAGAGAALRTAAGGEPLELTGSVDEAHLLEHSLPAAVAQEGADVVVIDNAGTDATAQLARAAGAAVLRLERRLPYTDAINAAVAATGGDAVLLLNADCFLAPGF